MEIILKKEDISEIVKEVACKLNKSIEKEETIPIFIGVMTGALNFMMDIIKHIKCDILTDYVHISSYKGNKSINKVNIKYEPAVEIQNRTIVLIEDFIDTGFSIDFLLSFLNRNYKPAKIILVALLERNSRANKHHDINIIGKKIDCDCFLIGYGLDYLGIGRNYEDIYACDKKDLERIKNKLKGVKNYV
ncbi:MAG: hypothetical protein J6Y70_00550 [Bacilli bacterium]|nr:hypothetical protein [Bacilli bacterium]